MNRLTFILVACIAFVGRVGGEEPAAETPRPLPSVFQLPQLQQQYVQLQLEIRALFQKGDYEQAEQKCADAVKLAPQLPDGYYNLACTQARQQKTDEALASLAKAVELGFNNAKQMKEDEDLAALRETDRFSEIVKQAETAKPAEGLKYSVEPAPIADGIAWVKETNTAWDPRAGVFRAFFKFESQPADDKSVIEAHGEIGNLLRAWFKEGTAAGNHGDLYDNHDGDHSNMAYQQFPQLARIEFGDEAKSRRLHFGFQSHFLYNAVTLGNSSTASVGNPYWRSQPRLAYTNPRLISLLYTQYVGNHIFMYPEHRDYDVGHNGPDGYGDVYPANTPYVIISQGSSGSDRQFMDAVACTLAGFRPEVKKLLTESGTLMPAVQMILRSSYKEVPAPEDYLTGKAHPTVFEGKQLDVLKMVKLAHEIERDAVPPMIQLRVVEEDQPIVGRDYFDAAERHRLFDTPAAIARICRSTKFSYHMVVSAEASRDLNDRPLTWKWVVLRGDADAITIKPLNDAGSVVEIVVPYHQRRPILPGSDMQSNRVDIGAFVHNGSYWSAPGFVTFFSFDNEHRTYNDKQLIQSVDYAADGVRGNYVDPALDLPKNWRDEYQYDDQDRLLGWTRHRGEQTERFTAGGALITKADESGRALEARTVKYIAAPRTGNQPPMLQQQPGDTILHYEYTSDDEAGP
jgi:YD repeat-containing protein